MTSLLALLVLAQPTSGRLQLTLPVGTLIKSDLWTTYTSEEDDLTLVIKQSVVSTVVKGEPGEVAIDHALTMTFMSFDGYERPLGGSKPTVIHEIRNTRGALKKLTGSDVDPEAGLVLSRLWSVPLPVDELTLGSEFTFTDNREKPYRVKGMFKQESTKTKVFELTYLPVDDNPAKAGGEAAIDLATGWPMAITYKIDRALIPGGDGTRADVDYQFRTSEIKLP